MWRLCIDAPGVRDRVTVKPFWDADVQRLLVRVNGQLWGYVVPCEVITRVACKPHHGLRAVDTVPIPVSCLRCGTNVYTCGCAAFSRIAEARERAACESAARTRNWRVFSRNV